MIPARHHQLLPAASPALFSALPSAVASRVFALPGRSGIATTLLQRMFDELGADAHVTLEVRPSNRGAIEMYEGLGFRAAGHRRGYYHDNGEDALIMWLDPPGPA